MLKLLDICELIVEFSWSDMHHDKNFEWFWPFGIFIKIDSFGDFETFGGSWMSSFRQFLVQFMFICDLMNTSYFCSNSELSWKMIHFDLPTVIIVNAWYDITWMNFSNFTKFQFFIHIDSFWIFDAKTEFHLFILRITPWRHLHWACSKSEQLGHFDCWPVTSSWTSKVWLGRT